MYAPTRRATQAPRRERYPKSGHRGATRPPPPCRGRCPEFGPWGAPRQRDAQHSLQGALPKAWPSGRAEAARGAPVLPVGGAAQSDHRSVPKQREAPPSSLQGAKVWRPGRAEAARGAPLPPCRRCPKFCRAGAPPLRCRGRCSKFGIRGAPRQREAPLLHVGSAAQSLAVGARRGSERRPSPPCSCPPRVWPPGHAEAAGGAPLLPAEGAAQSFATGARRGSETGSVCHAQRPNKNW